MGGIPRTSGGLIDRADDPDSATRARNRTGTRRAFDQAQDALQRMDPDDYRPVWLLAFYDQAELNSLALSAFLALGDYLTAEFHAHRCLATLRPHMRRSHAVTTT